MTVAEMLRGTEVVLLDFDGPVADLFPRGSGSRIGDRAREPLLRAGVELPEVVRATVQHLVVLEFAGVRAPQVVEDVERASVAGEVEAAGTAPVTPGVVEFLDACAETGRRVVVVSNNCGVAVQSFLEREGLVGRVEGVVGRPFGRPELMKPNPALIDGLLPELGVAAGRCLMVGDSASDIEFSRRVGMPSVGYAKSPERGAELAAAGADAIAHGMQRLGAAIRAVG
ncbi:Haloacid dehalogenase domain protein hydrolase [Kribbella flavida DSM 17836]|uniref:Haloacid dehalogenase domain protein hydrolase n=1 Tax=Kribbella flavida (strain DSM 17836 / JCM 10339 / NBRC 14399) TaxID=479435 RepID=D2PZK9_KRIFD|nr:HAD family hydrolase [Kribbella flavida]ADB35575.1 Haloacid dehalogenase domain protein hydrolase [Kribbella flavida DSM 17836]